MFFLLVLLIQVKTFKYMFIVTSIMIIASNGTNNPKIFGFILLLHFLIATDSGETRSFEGGKHLPKSVLLKLI